MGMRIVVTYSIRWPIIAIYGIIFALIIVVDEVEKDHYIQCADSLLSWAKYVLVWAG
jgi:hypothetical protein